MLSQTFNATFYTLKANPMFWRKWKKCDKAGYGSEIREPPSKFRLSVKWFTLRLFQPF